VGILAQGRTLEVPLSDFAPDLDPISRGVIVDMDGVIPTVKGYASRPAPESLGAPALAAKPIGGFVAQFSDGTVKVYAGTSSNLYRLDGTSWTSVGGPYSVTGDHWHFAQFGDDVIAVAKGVSPQVATGATGAFAALGGSPPANAEHVTVASGTVFMTRGADWFNSAVGTDNDWSPNIQTLAATGTIYELPGNITAVATLFRSVVLWKERGMWVGQFVGPPTTWSFSLVSTLTGCRGPFAAVNLPEAIAFLGTDDFYITRGYAPERIPNSLKEWFFATADPGLLHKVFGWYDPKAAIVYWHFVSKNPAVAGTPDTYVAWNVRTGKWAKGSHSTDFVVPVTRPGRDSGLTFGTDKIIRSWTGTPGAAYLRTGLVGQAGRITQVSRVRPRYAKNPRPDPNTAGLETAPNPQGESLIVWSYLTSGALPETTTSAMLTEDGWHDVLAQGRYHQFELETLGEMEVVALEIEGREAGVQ
jgi:hypothetical protein